MTENPYLPIPAVIRDIKPEAEETKTFTLSPGEQWTRAIPAFSPGQFVQVSAFGVGEAPISICSSPLNGDDLQISVRRAGKVTTALHESIVGDFIGLRGPYGNGWPLKKMTGRNILVVSGGIGMAPLRSLINAAIARRNQFGDIAVCYGARTPEGLMYRNEYSDWTDSGVEVLLTVDVPTEQWKHDVGVVTKLLDKIKVSPENTIASVCGPPVMIKFASRRLRQLGYPSQNIYASLESMMRCGIGKCGHCHFGGKHVCLDGPIFSYDEILGLPRDFVEL